ncbi:MAG: hypothetical protein MSH15_12150 [Oscillospiraceae bacterium]|nr:hypothetical protein [Oscillospiraceae bacterium]
MENIAEKLQSLLSDEEGLKQLQSLYDIISGEKKETGSEEEKGDAEACCSDEDMPDFDFGALLKLQSLFNSDNTGNKDTALLLALKPHLSEERQTRVDKAVKILNLINMLSVLKESGLINELI